MKRKCFLDSERDCTDKCMAYQITIEGRDGCVLLEAAQSFNGFFVSLTKPRNETKHPESAPPPKVI